MRGGLFEISVELTGEQSPESFRNPLTIKSRHGSAAESLLASRAIFAPVRGWRSERSHLAALSRQEMKLYSPVDCLGEHDAANRPPAGHAGPLDPPGVAPGK